MHVARDLITAINEELKNSAVVDAKAPLPSCLEATGKTSIKDACEYFVASRGQIAGT